jgi:hypothetical protein
MEKLNAGSIFPNFELRTVADSRLTIPANLKGRYAVLLFYRGGW